MSGTPLNPPSRQNLLEHPTIKWISHIFVAVGVICAIYSSFRYHQVGVLKETVDSYKTLAEAKDKEVDSLKKQVESLQRQLDRQAEIVKADKENNEKQLNIIKLQNEELKLQKFKLEAMNAELQTELSRLRVRLDEEKTAKKSN